MFHRPDREKIGIGFWYGLGFWAALFFVIGVAGILRNLFS